MEVHAAGTGDFLEKTASKNHLTQVCIKSACFIWARAIGVGEVQLGRLGRITLMVGGVCNAWECVCQPYPSHAWHTSGIVLVNL
jgi:hypothetical protein